jgi:hypothetical protein
VGVGPQRQRRRRGAEPAGDGEFLAERRHTADRAGLGAAERRQDVVAERAQLAHPVRVLPGADEERSAGDEAARETESRADSDPGADVPAEPGAVTERFPVSAPGDERAGGPAAAGRGLIRLRWPRAAAAR